MRRSRNSARLVALAGLLLGCAHAGVLPDDRFDVLYHHYNGGGMNIQGPSILVRKKIGDHVSLAGNYYVDNITGHIDSISGASVDAVSGASSYHEERKQESLSIDVLQGKTTYSAGYITGNENDYWARTAFASISEDMFGDLTTISFGFTRGWDKVGKVGQTATSPLERRNWQLGLSQVLTRNLLLGLNFETSESEGLLNNPYRMVRYLDPQSLNGRGFTLQPEQYPHTRTGNAGSGQLKYYLPWHAALAGNYRYYSDTWGIVGHTFELGYTQPLFGSWTLDTHARYYRQTHADFYSDLFPYASAQNFMARDRELATFKNLTLGFGATWEFHPTRLSWLQKSTLNLHWDRMRIQYGDYREAWLSGLIPGTEPLYTLNANVVQFFLSGWF
ncbi:MAG TPA: DUF3570 domain-containing protein [Steroidobacteraceae bacterium]|nr:DUF3570 domain-containing protein [Steroidobacteraceae bacterium]